MAVSIWEGNKAQALIDAIVGNIEKVNAQQGAGNAGKALIVGEDGIVTTAYTTLSDMAITALLNCFAHVTWSDSYGQQYYDMLEAALREGRGHDSGILTLDDLTISIASTGTDYENGNLFLNPVNTKNITLCSSFGVKPYNDTNGDPLNLYPIQIPEWAKSVIFSSTPLLQYDLSTRVYDNNNQKYENTWVQSTGKLKTLEGINLYGETHLTAQIGTLDNTVYTDEQLPAEVSIAFLKTYIRLEKEWANSLKTTSTARIVQNRTPVKVGNVLYVSTETKYSYYEPRIYNSHPLKYANNGNDAEKVTLVPASAKTVTISVTPSSYYLKVYLAKYDISTKYYNDILLESNLTQGSVTLQIPDDNERKYLFIFITGNSSGSSAPTSITDVSVAFE